MTGDRATLVFLAVLAAMSSHAMPVPGSIRDALQSKDRKKDLVLYVDKSSQKSGFHW